jgi:hypothetical protein
MCRNLSKPAPLGNHFFRRNPLPLERLCRNSPRALRQAQGERLIDCFLMCRSPFMVSLTNHERNYDTVSEVGGRGGDLRGFQLWLLIGGGILFGSLGRLFFLFSNRRAHLDHLGNHLGAFEGMAAFGLHHLPHHLRKGRPFATTFKSLFTIFLILRHVRVPPFFGGL